MSEHRATPAPNRTTGDRSTRDTTTGDRAPARPWLAAGALAGPLFLTVWSVQAATRAGFDPSRHPLSLLSLGDFGWVQIGNFVITGALYLGGAIGLRRALGRGRGRTWGPRLVAGFGLGLVLAGVFVTDAGAGFPAGAPAGAPEGLSWHGALHEIGFGFAQLCWLAAAAVTARSFVAERRWGWATTCAASLLAALAIVAWPDLDTFATRSIVATAVEQALLTALTLRLLLRSAPAPASGTAGSGRAAA